VEKLGVSETAIGNWEKKGVFPMPDKWAAIKQWVEIDPAEYWVPDEERTQVISDRSAGNIVAKGSSSVSVGCMVGSHALRGMIQVDITEDEFTILNKFRRIGSPSILLEKCLQKLTAVEAMIG